MTEAVNTLEQKRRRLDLIRKQAAARKAAAESRGGGQTFEIEGPEGQVYEVQAESLEAAAKAVNDLSTPEKPWGQVLKENLLGDDDPTTQNTGEKIGSFLNKAGESLTFGLVGDEASAKVESALGIGRPTAADLVTGDNRSAYERRRDHYRQQEDQFAEDHPVAALGAEFVPLAVPGVGAMAAAAKGTTMTGRMLRGGAVAGGQGTTYGFMEGEDGLENRLQQGATTGALSAGIGALAPVVGRGVEKYADHRATKRATNEMVKNAPSPQALKDDATGFYNAGKARGAIASAEDAQGLAADVAETLKREGVMRADGSLITRDPDAKRILDELQDLGRFGLDGNQVKPVRELFSGAASDASPARARIGKILLDKFDDFVGQRAPEYRQGDELYRRAKKTEAVDQMIDVADTSDTANALRREFQKADRNQIKGKLGGMTSDEITAMQRVARGSRMENTARAVGRSAPSSVSGAMFTGGVPFASASMAGSPGIGAAVGGTVLAAGMAGRGISNSMQRARAEIAKALMASGGTMPQAIASDPLKQKIMELLLGGAPRAGQMIGGVLDQ
ncbi:hypothetical protein [uncultured Roseovarius sp.]|uniref:hypothetical protein n=1 Tax=uncultured Roseovarius sp. TaxID=293344 RepID=UPI0026053E4F|nr:hypothetical protein [uncultured Roseovarius sp.]